MDMSERICLLRLSAIGDVCHVLPVLRTLQKHKPRARLTWVIGRTEAQLVHDIPGVEFQVFDKRNTLRSVSYLRREFAGSSFDVLLNMQASFRAGLASACIPARRKIGFDPQRAKFFHPLFSNERIEHHQSEHVLDSFFGFLAPLGIYDRVLRWDIPIPGPASEFASSVIPDQGGAVVISPCSSVRFRNWRNWSPAKYAAVADYAREKHGLQVVLTGGPSREEKAMGARIQAEGQYELVDLIGGTNLKQLLALLQRCRVLVSPDSGPLHMATAVGTPVVGLYATSNPDRTGPYLSRQWVVNKYPQALKEETGKDPDHVPWGRRVRKAEVMDLITVQDVREKLDQVLRET